MKFLLLHIAPPYRIYSMSKRYKGNLAVSPLGLLYIGSSLEDEGHIVEIIDFNIEEDPIASLIKSLQSADAVGVHVNSYILDEVVKVTNMIKQFSPSIPIILGGPHCCFFPRNSLLDIPSGDISVEGEAEETIKDIAIALEGNKHLSSIPGIHFKKNDSIKKGKNPKIIENLDSLSFPSRHLVEKYDYGSMNKLDFYRPRFTSMITSRGCPYKCKFCTRNVSTYKHYRQRSAENIIEELQVMNNDYGSAMIVDDNFFSDSKRVHKIMDGIINNGIDINFIIEGTRVDSSDKELYKKMKKAGVKQLYFGIESGNQDVLDFYNKKVKLDQIKKAVKLANKMNFLTTGNFIFGAPIETEQHIMNTIKFANSLPLDVVLFNPLGYVHGSDLWIEAVKDGKIGSEDGYETIADLRKGLGNFTKEELEDYCKIAFKRFYLRPKYIVCLLYRTLKRRNLNLIRIGYDYF